MGAPGLQRPPAVSGTAADPSSVTGLGNSRKHLDRLNSNGEGTIYYPSGRIALTACKSPDGYFYTFTSDTQRFQVLANFESGIGGVNHPDGKPWLVATLEGWSLSTPEGRIIKGGTWPRSNAASEPLSLKVSPHLTVSFVDRQHIKAHLNFADVDRVFDCGEYSRRRSDTSYLEKVVGVRPGGRLDLDVGLIRRRIREVGSVYVAKGPHHFVTPQPGLGNLKSMLAGVRSESPIHAMVVQLDDTQARIQRINTLRIEPYGTAHPPKRFAQPLPDFGSPGLSESQRKMADKMKRSEGARPAYNLKRRKLPLISVNQLEEGVWGPGTPDDILFAVCVLADWSPVCARLEHQHLQVAAWELSEAAAATPSGDEAHVRVVKVDGSESRTLQGRLGFRTAPMFLFFFGGRLVDAGNDVRSKEEMLERSLSALAAGRRGEALPDGFSFKGSDNKVLDSITHNMSLLRRGT